MSNNIVADFYKKRREGVISIPMPHLEKLNKILRGFCQYRIYLLGADTGSGKTTFVDYNIYNLIQNKGSRKIHFIYYTLEMSEFEKIGAFTTNFIYNKHNEVIEVEEVLGFGRKSEDEETPEERIRRLYVDDLVASVEDELNYLTSFITFKEKMNPTGMFKDVKAAIEQSPDTFFIVIVDHVGLIKREKLQGEYLNKKQTIDKTSEYAVELRNTYGCSFMFIQQLNRALGEILRRKHEELVVTLEDFKDSGNIAEDANAVFGMFSPLRYNIKEYAGYDLTVLKDNFRPFQIIKHRNGRANLRMSLFFRGDAKYYKELPPAKGINYNDILKW